jgi:sugar-specific transcriptional regulator TrmB
MNIAVTGTPNFPRLDLVRQFVERLPEDTMLHLGEDQRKLQKPETVDATLAYYAHQRGLDRRISPYRWSRWGRYALSERHKEMLQDADLAVVFWLPKMGTYEMIVQVKDKQTREQRHMDASTGQVQLRIVYPDGHATDGSELEKRRATYVLRDTPPEIERMLSHVRAVWSP